ncbi:MAG: hypothetical protein R3C03_00415 [Pirellulaceae bacterium]
MKQILVVLSASLFAAATVISTGCSTMMPFAQNDIPTTEQSVGGGQFEIITVSNMGTKNGYKGVVRENLTVQAALEEAGAIKPFSEVSVDLMRVVPESGRTLKMACEFQPGKKILKYEQDYQILPGDRIIVTPTPSGIGKIFRK